MMNWGNWRVSGSPNRRLTMIRERDEAVEAPKPRRLTDEDDMEFKAPIELKIGLIAEADRLAKSEDMSWINVRGHRRKKKPSELVTWIVADWMSQSRSERTARARNGRVVIEKKMESPEGDHFDLSADRESAIVQGVPLGASVLQDDGRPINKRNKRDLVGDDRPVLKTRNAPRPRR